MSDHSFVRGRPATSFPLLAWLFLSLGAAHACAAAADLLPGGAGGSAAAVDAVVAFAVLAGLAVHRWGPTELVTRLTPPGVVLLVVVAAAASGVRGAAAGEPWFGADVVLAVLAATAVPGLRAFAVALVGAEAAWLAALLAGASSGADRGTSTAGWALLGVLAVFAAGFAAGLRWSAVWLRSEVDRAVASVGLHAVTDPVTGANNRRGLERLALPMIEHARRQGEAVHCLFVDVDDFRLVNDRLSRDRGDDVLSAVHEALLASIRATDVVARWAGDQFVVLGPGTGTSPLEMERRVRTHLAADPPVPVDAWTGAVSIGSATLVPWDEGNLDSLLSRAEEDMHLRRSLRRQGRVRPRSLPARPVADEATGAVEASGGAGAPGIAGTPTAPTAPDTDRRTNPPQPSS